MQNKETKSASRVGTSICLALMIMSRRNQDGQARTCGSHRYAAWTLSLMLTGFHPWQWSSLSLVAAYRQKQQPPNQQQNHTPYHRPSIDRSSRSRSPSSRNNSMQHSYHPQVNQSQHEYPSFDESLAFPPGQGISPNALSTPSDNRTISGFPLSGAMAGSNSAPTSGFQTGIPVNTFNPSGGSTAAWLDSLLGEGTGSGVRFPTGEDLMDGMDFSSIHPRGGEGSISQPLNKEGFEMGFDGIAGTPGRASFGQYSDALGTSPGGGSVLRNSTTTFPPGPTQSSDSPDWPLKLSAANKKMPQVEDVVSWSDLCYFISLFLKYLYPLMPIVHRPTFAENLATRLDIRDPSFRALLLSIGGCARRSAFWVGC